MRPALALLAALALAPGLGAGELLLWTLENGAMRGPPAGSRPLPAGSLLKPFVAMAWAGAHPGATPPVERCERTSGCWRPSGHGSVGLVRALAVSCNAYFKKMAAGTPAEALEAVLRAQGFAVPSPLTPEAAIGLGSGEDAVTAQPEAILRAYARLPVTPWPGEEDVRRTVLAGLRDAASSGTASGLGRRGFWAKTGTVPALDGRPLATSGWVVAVDDSGWAILGLLPDGTGREAAGALAEPLGRLRPWAVHSSTSHRASVARSSRTTARPHRGHALDPAQDRVRVGLLGALEPRTVVARNLGPAPARSSRGYVGPGARLVLRAGDRLDESLWEVALTAHRLLRRFRAAILVDAGSADTLRLRAEMRPEEYVAGVLAGELPEGGAERRVALGAAVLRFLSDGPRHGAYDVCDRTHCAWFVGRGPRVLWPTPRTPVLLARSPGGDPQDLALDAATWTRIRAEAERDGPRLFTGHCGGASLAPHFVWGSGDRRVSRCGRHGPDDRAAWAREWSGADLARAFGEAVTGLEVTAVDGVWTLRARTIGARRELRYDEAHRLLAQVLGWDALPSPADRVFRSAGGFRAEGAGRGHRVGLCLAD